eukprot:SAG11_NODE_201_length_12551_cov_67.866126_8_plen_85_part_00
MEVFLNYHCTLVSAYDMVVQNSAREERVPGHGQAQRRCMVRVQAATGVVLPHDGGKKKCNFQIKLSQHPTIAHQSQRGATCYFA